MGMVEYNPKMFCREMRVANNKVPPDVIMCLKIDKKVDMNIKTNK